MPTKEDKKIGLLIMCLGIAAAIFFFWFFKFDGVVIDARNPVLVMKFLLTVLCLIAGLYFGLRFVSGKKAAAQIGGGLVIFMLIAFTIGFLRH